MYKLSYAVTLTGLAQISGYCVHHYCTTVPCSSNASGPANLAGRSHDPAMLGTSLTIVGPQPISGVLLRYGLLNRSVPIGLPSFDIKGANSS